MLRYLAPDKPGNFTATYEVAGPDGQTRAGERAHLGARAERRDEQPAGARDGDGARARRRHGAHPDPADRHRPGRRLGAAARARKPTREKGAVTTVGDDYIDYEAGDYSAGTDTFTYTVIDALGARATGTVRVGISAKLDGARNPVAIEDEVTRAARRTVSVQVLAERLRPRRQPAHLVSVTPNDPTASPPTSSATWCASRRRASRDATGSIYTIANDRRHQLELRHGDRRRRRAARRIRWPMTPCSPSPTSSTGTRVDVDVLRQCVLRRRPGVRRCGCRCCRATTPARR